MTKQPQFDKSYSKTKVEWLTGIATSATTPIGVPPREDKFKKVFSTNSKNHPPAAIFASV
jgi:hypothetical protein